MHPPFTEAPLLHCLKPSTTRGALLALLLCTAAPAARAEDAPWPHDPLIEGWTALPQIAADDRFDDVDPAGIDYTHLELSIDLPPFRERRFEITETLTAQVRHGPTRRIVLAGIGLDVSDVQCPPGRPRDYLYDGHRLTVLLDEPLTSGEQITLRIAASGTEPAWGLRFVPDCRAEKGEGFIYAAGYADWNRHWLFVPPDPNDALTTEITISVVPAYRAIAPGREVHAALDTRRLRRVFRWDNSVPAPTRSLLFAVGRFDETSQVSAGHRCTYLVPRGRQREIAPTFFAAPRILAAIEQRLDTPYPWPTCTFVVVPGLEWPAVAGPGIVLVSPRILIDAADPDVLRPDTFIAHMLAHQWFGVAHPPRTPADEWLTEAFATLLESVWLEHSAGPDAGTYHTGQTLRNALDSDLAGTIRLAPQHDGADTDLFDTSARRARARKGAAVLHMLRNLLPTGTFDAALTALLSADPGTPLSTRDLRLALEAASARSLERLFEDWIRRPGLPDLAVRTRWDRRERMLHVTVRQRQPTSRDRPAFALDLPLLVQIDDATHRHILHVTAREQAFALTLPARPRAVVADPDGILPAHIEQPGSASQWRDLIRKAPTLHCRLLAIREAAASAGSAQARSAPTGDASAAEPADAAPDDAVSLLEALLFDRSEFWGVRAEAARGLATINTPAALDVLEAFAELPAIETDPRVRLAVLETFARFRCERALRLIMKHIVAEPAPQHIAASVRGLAGFTRPNLGRYAVEPGLTPSPGDRISLAALETLTALRDPLGLPLAMRLASPCATLTDGRVPLTAAARIEAARTIGVLAPLAGDAEQTDAAALLIDLLADPDYRVRAAAAGALARLDLPEASRAVATRLRSPAHSAVREAARRGRRPVTAADSPDLARFKADLDSLQADLENLTRSLSRHEAARSAPMTTRLTRPPPPPPRSPGSDKDPTHKETSQR